MCNANEKELLLLELRNAIADKEWSISCANMETASAGAWTCDWQKGMREADAEIHKILDVLKYQQP